MKLIQGLDPTRVRPLVTLHQNDDKLAAFLGQQNLDFVVAPEARLLEPKGLNMGQRGRASTTWLYLTKAVPRMRRFLRAHGVDVVHTNDGRVHANWALPARAAGAKLLWHHRGDPRARGVNILAPVLAHHIVTVSRFASPDRPVLPVNHKLSVVHSPFDHPAARFDRSRAHGALASELGYPPETKFLGYFGGLIDRKRPVAFVDAVHAFIRRHPDIPVAGVLFGQEAPDGPPLEAAVRKRAAELEIGNRIHLMGFRHPIEPWMCATDILLVPAVREPFGRTLIEAMLLGTPVVATNHGGNPEAINDGETGFLVEADDPEAFTAPIHRLLADPECWRYVSGTARDRALSSYSLERHVERLTGIYEGLCRQRSPRPAPAPAVTTR